mmetsp:Transcript_19254/g.17077  ORF Transcript_19254/g.17077 Transcript_19254/m.17077 type:complete len:177 (-) Transcript_19254:38-568(-)
MFEKVDELKIDYTKKLFGDIIERIVGKESMAFQTLIKGTKMTNLFRKFKAKKRQAKYLSKKDIPIKEKYISKDWSEKYIEFFIKERKFIWKYHKNMTSIIQQFVKLRNQILNLNREHKNCFCESDIFNQYTKKDLVNLFKVIGDLEKSEGFKVHDLWDIPKKNHDKEEYEDGERTE